MDLVSWVFCLLFLLAGLLMIVGSLRVVWKGWRARFWPQTTGTVQKAEFRSYESPGADSTTTWEHRVRYEYTVAGERFEGTRIHPGYSASSRLATHQVLSDLLQPGRQVRVFYNARRPAECTLAVGVYSITFAIFLAGWVFASLGGGMLMHAYGLIHPGAIVISCMAGLAPAFYFIIFGRGDFADGIKVEGKSSEKRRKRRR